MTGGICGSACSTGIPAFRMDEFRILRRERALRDLEALTDYLDQHAGPRVAIRFLDAAERSFDQLARHPLMGRAFASFDPRLQELRIFQVAGFARILVYYRPLVDGVEVIRVIHGARDQEAVLTEDDLDWQ